MRRALALVLLLAPPGCGSNPAGGDAAPPEDSAVPADSATADAGPVDAGPSTDTGTPGDAGSPDAGAAPAPPPGTVLCGEGSVTEGELQAACASLHLLECTSIASLPVLIDDRGMSQLRGTFAVFLALALISTASLGAAEEASLSANGIVERHAFPPLGTPKYGADFAHFDYVNPTAPKGGRISIGNGGRFDSLNPFILKGLPANPVTLTYDRLMVPSLDEAGVLYGLVAESVAYPKDFAWITFKLRPQARWHDGEPVTAEDVVFSFTALRADGLPIYRFGFGDVAKVEALDTHRVRFTIARRGNRQLVAQLAEMPVLPKHYWQGTDESGKPRDLGETTLEPPLTSGPYRVGEVKHGRTVELVRVPDYWGRDLPVNVGSHNLDRILYDYMQDQGIAREAFKAGEFDVWTENHSMHWAIGFDLPAVREGRMKRLASPNANPTPCLRTFPSAVSWDVLSRTSLSTPSRCIAFVSRLEASKRCS